MVSCAEETSTSASATTAFEDDAVGLALGAIDQESEQGDEQFKDEQRREVLFFKDPQRVRSEKKIHLSNCCLL